MPTISERLEAAVAQTETDSDLLHTIIHGTTGDSPVTTEGGPVRTAAKAIEDLGNSANYVLKSLGNADPGSVIAALIASQAVTLAKLSSDVLLVLQGGLDGNKYKGLWTPATDTPTIPAASGGNLGEWYLAVAAGTAVGNAAGTYAYWDAIVSDGAAWLKRPAPPSVIAPGAVTFTSLDATLQALITILETSYSVRPTLASSVDGKAFVIAIGDKEIASVDMSGRVTLLLAPGAVTGEMLQSASILYHNLASDVTSLMPKKTFMRGRMFEIGIDGKVVLGITSAGLVSPGGGVVVGGDLNERGYPNHAAWGRWNLRDWHRLAFDRLLGTSSVIDVLCIGDSWTWNGATWLTYTSRQLKALLGDAGPGFISFSATTVGTTATIGSFSDTSDGNASKTGTWSKPSNFEGRGPDLGEATSLVVGDKVTLTLNVVCNAVVLKYLNKVGGGLMRYRWNGGAWTSIDTVDLSDVVGSTSLAGVPASAPSTLEVEVQTSGTTGITLFGADCQKAGPGIRFHKCGHSGARASHFSVASGLWETVVSGLSPKLTIAGFGTNDQAVPVLEDDFVSYESNVCDRLRTVRAGMDILLFAPSENLAGRATPITVYRDGAYRVATSKRCAFVDLFRLFGSSTSEYNDAAPRVLFSAGDPLHPAVDGNKLIATGILEVLKPR